MSKSSSCSEDEVLLILDGIRRKSKTADSVGCLFILKRNMGFFLCWEACGYFKEQEHEIGILMDLCKEVKSSIKVSGMHEFKKTLYENSVLIPRKVHSYMHDVKQIGKLDLGFDSNSRDDSIYLILRTNLPPHIEDLFFVTNYDRKGCKKKAAMRRHLVEELKCWFNVLGLVSYIEENCYNGVPFSTLVIADEESNLDGPISSCLLDDQYDEAEAILDPQEMMAFDTLLNLGCITRFFRNVPNWLGPNGIFSQKRRSLLDENMLLEGERVSLLRDVYSQKEKSKSNEPLDDSLLYEDIIEMGLHLNVDGRTEIYQSDVDKYLSENQVLDFNHMAMRLAVFKTGLSDAIRGGYWLYLLKVFPLDSNVDDREKIVQSHEDEYHEYLNSWINLLENPDFDDFDNITPDSFVPRAGITREHEEFKNISMILQGIAKDVRRSYPSNNLVAYDKILMRQAMRVMTTYAVYDREIGYVQGMNDLLMPILQSFRCESTAYLGFKYFMMSYGRRNFLRDQSGINFQLSILQSMIKFFDPSFYRFLEANLNHNLLFCFRWILVFFRREFLDTEVRKIWDVMLACPITRFYHLFICLAIINKYRKQCEKSCKEFDDFLRFFNSLRELMDVQDILIRADTLLRGFVFKYITEFLQFLDKDRIPKLLLDSLTNFISDVSAPDLDALKVEDPVLEQYNQISDLAEQAYDYLETLDESAFPRHRSASKKKDYLLLMKLFIEQ